MTGPTHRVYSVLFAFITTIVLYHTNITQINYYLILLIILAFSKSGAIFPDLDHAWRNVGIKNLLNKVVNTIIHITGGKHRSWQTHSIDICTIYTLAACIVPKILLEKEIMTLADKEILTLILLGFASGWISHLFSDMLTSGGVRLICFLKFKIKLVPKKIGKLKFNTGNEWEAFNYKVISFTNTILGIICLIYPIITNTNIINNLTRGN